MYIYKITNSINGKVYIGRTTRSLEQRWSEHLRSAQNGNTQHLYCAMRKYGVEKFYIEPLEECTSIEELSDAEARWVIYYDSYYNGYNMTYAGESNPMDCDKSRDKHDQKMRTPAVRAKISESMKAFKAAHAVSKITREKLSSYRSTMCFIYKDSVRMQVPKVERETYLARGWESGTGPCDPEVVMRRAVSRARYVYCVDAETGELVSEFSSVGQAAEWLISTRCSGILKGTAMGKIKKSATRNICCCGLKWFYGRYSA